MRGMHDIAWSLLSQIFLPLPGCSTQNEIWTPPRILQIRHDQRQHDAHGAKNFATWWVCKVSHRKITCHCGFGCPSAMLKWHHVSQPKSSSSEGKPCKKNSNQADSKTEHRFPVRTKHSCWSLVHFQKVH